MLSSCTSPSNLLIHVCNLESPCARVALLYMFRIFAQLDWIFRLNEGTRLSLYYRRSLRWFQWLGDSKTIKINEKLMIKRNQSKEMDVVPATTFASGFRRHRHRQQRAAQLWGPVIQTTEVARHDSSQRPSHLQ
jgi:hypothetical protein